MRFAIPTGSCARVGEGIASYCPGEIVIALFAYPPHFSRIARSTTKASSWPPSPALCCPVYWWVTIDSDGDLAVSQPVMMRGGVTETYLRHMLGFWRATIARVEKSIEKHADAADRRTLN